MVQPSTVQNSKGLRILTENPVCREHSWTLSEGALGGRVQHLEFHGSIALHSFFSIIALPLMHGDTGAQKYQVILSLITQSTCSVLFNFTKEDFIFFIVCLF